MQVISERGLKKYNFFRITMKEFVEFLIIYGVVEIAILDKIASKFKRIMCKYYSK